MTGQYSRRHALSVAVTRLLPVVTVSEGQCGLTVKMGSHCNNNTAVLANTIQLCRSFLGGAVADSNSTFMHS
jgi:hypothetical protein